MEYLYHFIFVNFHSILAPLCIDFVLVGILMYNLQSNLTSNVIAALC